MPFDHVLVKAAELNATPFDIPGVEFTHYEDKCTFDYFLDKYDLQDEALHRIAPIVRGADTNRHDLATQASGLWAISAGLAYNYSNDQDLLEKGMLLYDALYTWAKHLYEVKHLQQPYEQLLLQVFNQYLKGQKGNKNAIPRWAKELKEIIQDQIDTNLTLKEIYKDMNIHPSYLSREFSKYFDNMSFGEYIQKQRIERAISYMQTSTLSLTEIAYLTGFSDQSHFTRIFKKHTGKNPLVYKKYLQ